LFAHLERAKTADLTEAERKRVEMVAAFTRFSATYYDMWQLKEQVFLGDVRADDVERARTLEEAAANIMVELSAHPEWFVGSSVKADSLHAREWPTAALERQMKTVQSTAASLNQEDDRPIPTFATRGTELLALQRSEHPWYKAWQSVPLLVDSRVRGGLTFRSRDNGTIQSVDDPRYDGEFKFQWLHAKTRDIESGLSGVLAVTVEVQGREGMLQVELVNRARDSEVTKATLAESVLDFGDRESSKRLRVEMDPKDWGDTPTRPNLQLRLLWKPLKDDATLTGTAVLEAK
jgi:hypothetical protein